MMYKVSVKPAAYLAMLQKLDKAVGMKRLQGIDPSTYEGGQPIQMVVTIDTLSRTLTEVSYVGTNRTETYSDYGIIKHIELPKDTIPKAELEQKLQNVLGGV